MEHKVHQSSREDKPKSRFYLLKVYIWTLSFLKPYRGQLFLHIAFGLLITAGELAVPKIIQYFVDTILPEKDLQQFWFVLGIVAILFMCVIGFQAARNLLERHITEKAARDIQFTIFQKLRKLGFSYFERRSVGESLSLMNTEVTALQKLYQEHLPKMLELFFIFIIIFFILLSMNAKLVLMIIPWFLLYYLIGPIIEKITYRAVKEATKERIALNKKYYDSISGLTEVRAYNREEWDIQEVDKQVDRFSQTWGKMVILEWMRGVPRRFIIYLSAVILFAYGAHLVQQEALTVGEFIAFVLYYLRLIFSYSFFITHVTESKLLMIQAEKLYDFMQESSEVNETKEPIPLSEVRGCLTFSNVYFSYPTKQNVISSFSLDINPGEKVALVGMSGSGKSTILKLIGRFYDPSKGRMYLDGIEFSKLSLAQLRQSMGFVFQETYLFGTTIKENIRFGNPAASDEQVLEATKAANAHGFIMNLPNGYETEVGERGYKLSGGQKQRIAIARMFLKSPAMIILDEATSALDNVSEREVQGALDHLMLNRTTITVAHRLSTIQKYDRIVVMEHGKIVEVGNYQELINKKGFLYQLAKGGDQVAQY